MGRYLFMSPQAIEEPFIAVGSALLSLASGIEDRRRRRERKGIPRYQSRPRSDPTREIC